MKDRPHSITREQRLLAHTTAHGEAGNWGKTVGRILGPFAARFRVERVYDEAGLSPRGRKAGAGRARARGTHLFRRVAGHAVAQRRFR